MPNHEIPLEMRLRAAEISGALSEFQKFYDVCMQMRAPKPLCGYVSLRVAALQQEALGMRELIATTKLSD